MRELEITVEILFPLFLLLALGWVLRRIGWMSAQLTRETNKLIFQLFLPVLVFNNISDMASGVSMDAGYAAYLFFGLLGIHLLAAVFVPRFEKHPQKRGVMVQGIFRTNFAALGAPLMEAMFGESGLAMYSLALPIVIPLNNILAVIALSSPGQKRLRPLEMLKSIVTNPLIIGCILGGIMLLTHLQLPTVVDSALRQVGGLASPLSLLVLGASLQWQGVRDNRTELVWTVLLKQVIIPLVMLGLAVLLGFRNEALGVMLILFGAPCAISSYPMAEAMGGDGPLAASQVVLTTLCSMGTLFVLVYVGKLFAWL